MTSFGAAALGEDYSTGWLVLIACCSRWALVR
jgi:hypothetical protein